MKKAVAMAMAAMMTAALGVTAMAAVTSQFVPERMVPVQEEHSSSCLAYRKRLTEKRLIIQLRQQRSQTAHL